MITAADLELHPLGARKSYCDCCGRDLQSIWGDICRRGGAQFANYSVQWSVDVSLADHPANFDFVLGEFAEGSSPLDRYAICLLHFEKDNQGGVMLIDAHTRAVGTCGIAGKALKRDEVVGTPHAGSAFDLFDAIVLHDERLYKPLTD